MKLTKDDSLTRNELECYSLPTWKINQILKNQVKAIRYDELENRYLNQNEKHFGELLSLYFEDEKT